MRAEVRDEHLGTRVPNRAEHPVASREHAWAANECPQGQSTVSGTYLHTFNGDGYLIGPKGPMPAATGALFVAAGQTVFDGVSQIVWRDSSSLGGLSILDREFVGTYVIDPQTCLGVISTAGFGEVARIIASPNGDEVFFLNSFPGVTITGIFRRVPTGSCSPGSFTGSYRSLVEGALYKGGATVNNNAPSERFAGVGRLVVTTSAGGSGTFEWSTTDSTGGKIEQRTLRGTHAFDFARCRALAQVTEECVDGSCKSVPAGSSTGRFTASPIGDQLVYVSTTTNVTVFGRLTRQ